MKTTILIIAATMGLAACATRTERVRVKSPYENRQEVTVEDALGGTHRTVDIDRTSGRDDCLEQTGGNLVYCDGQSQYGGGGGYGFRGNIPAPPGVHQFAGSGMDARYAQARAASQAPFVPAPSVSPSGTDPRTDAIVRQLGKTTEVVQQNRRRIQALEGDSE